MIYAFLRILVFSLLVFPVFAGGPNCSNLFPSVSSDGSKLYFSSDRHSIGGNYEIYRSDLDGYSNLERLTFSSVNNYYAVESPDGSKIVWQVNGYGSTAEVMIMNSDGTGQLNLTNNSVYDGSPNFSPDGQKIVFDGWDGDQYPEIFTMNIDGSNRLQITNVGGADWQSTPVYDPTGSYIYFLKGYNADNHIVKMNLDGTDWVDITGPNNFGIAEGGVRFSPDGQKITFLTTEYVGYNYGTDIVVADLDGSNWNKITNSSLGSYYYCPFWHPSVNKIYYCFNLDGISTWSLNEMSPDGTDQLMISNCSNVGLTELTDPVFKIYPNPASSNVYFEFVTGDKIEFYDLVGKMVLVTNLGHLDCSGLATGHYQVVLRMNTGEIIDVQTLIIN